MIQTLSKIRLLQANLVHINPVRSTWKLSRRLELPTVYRKKPAINPYIVGAYLKDVNPQPEFPEVYNLYDHTNEIDTDQEPKSDVKIILLENVEGIGGIGDVIDVSWEIARFKLIMSKKATYASEFNLKWYRDLIENKSSNILRPSSIESPFTKRGLMSRVFTLLMSDTKSWTIQPVHIETALRKEGVFIRNAESIILPETPIKGPDMDKQLKVLLATIVINNHERVPTRFVITHKNVKLREEYWAGWLDPVLPEQKSELEKLPLIERTVKYDEEDFEN